MVAVYKTIGAVSTTRAAVLLRGETGTGKELIARTIHHNSAEAGHPFIAVNCAAVPETLLESTLFGHVQGAFTGASSDRRGPFEMAGRGTLFLDEIGDTPLTLQAKLLRVLEEREFYPVGSEEPRRTEARMIAATNRNLEEMVKEGELPAFPTESDRDLDSATKRPKVGHPSVGPPHFGEISCGAGASGVRDFKRGDGLSPVSGLAREREGNGKRSHPGHGHVPWNRPFSVRYRGRPLESSSATRIPFGPRIRGGIEWVQNRRRRQPGRS